LSVVAGVLDLVHAPCRGLSMVYLRLERVLPWVRLKESSCLHSPIHTHLQTC